MNNDSDGSNAKFTEQEIQRMFSLFNSKLKSQLLESYIQIEDLPLDFRKIFLEKLEDFNEAAANWSTYLENETIITDLCHSIAYWYCPIKWENIIPMWDANLGQLKIENKFTLKSYLRSIFQNKFYSENQPEKEDLEDYIIENNNQDSLMLDPLIYSSLDRRNEDESDDDNEDNDADEKEEKKLANASSVDSVVQDFMNYYECNYDVVLTESDNDDETTMIKRGFDSGAENLPEHTYTYGPYREELQHYNPSDNGVSCEVNSLAWIAQHIYNSTFQGPNFLLSYFTENIIYFTETPVEVVYDFNTLKKLNLEYSNSNEEYPYDFVAIRASHKKKDSDKGFDFAPEHIYHTFILQKGEDENILIDPQSLGHITNIEGPDLAFQIVLIETIDVDLFKENLLQFYGQVFDTADQLMKITVIEEDNDSDDDNLSDQDDPNQSDEVDNGETEENSDDGPQEENKQANPDDESVVDID